MTAETVAVVRTGYPDLAANFDRLIELAGGLPLSAGDEVAIKINMCDARQVSTGAISDPRVLDNLLRHLRERYENLTLHVVESNSTVVIADEFIRWFGYLPVLERWGANWHNLSTGGIVDTPITGYYLQSVPVPELLTRAKLISLSKLKTNVLSTITAALKNQFGCLPMAEKSVFHDHLAKVIADVNVAMTPVFSIVDGIIAMGGARGPAFGVPLQAEVLLAGTAPVTVDSAVATCLGFRPAKVEHLRLAAARGLGSLRFETVGDPLPRLNAEFNRLDMLQATIAGTLRKMQRTRTRGGWRKRQNQSTGEGAS